MVKEGKSGKGSKGGWFKPKTFRADLDELGYPQFWVDLKQPGSFLLGEADDIENALGDTEDANADQIGEVFAKIIVDWNLTDPMTGGDLSVPVEGDSKSVRRLPTSILRFLQQELADYTEEYSVEGAVKKGIEMQPEATLEGFEAQ